MVGLAAWMACSEPTTTDSGAPCGGEVAAGTVRDTDGVSLAGADVFARSEGGPDVEGKTDRIGAFSLCLPDRVGWELFASWISDDGLRYCNAGPTPFLGQDVDLVGACSYID